MKQIFLCDDKNYGEFDRSSKGFSINEINSYYTSVTNISKTNFEYLYDMNVNIEKDFELIHGLYLETLLQFDFDKDLDTKFKLDTIWKSYYEPWFKIEKDKKIFWDEITKKIQNLIFLYL